MNDNQADDLTRANQRRAETLAAYLNHSAGEGPYFPSNASLHLCERAEQARKHRDRVEDAMMRDRVRRPHGKAQGER